MRDPTVVSGAFRRENGTDRAKIILKRNYSASFIVLVGSSVGPFMWRFLFVATQSD